MTLNQNSQNAELNAWNDSKVLYKRIKYCCIAPLLVCDDRKLLYCFYTQHTLHWSREVQNEIKLLYSRSTHSFCIHKDLPR